MRRTLIAIAAATAFCLAAMAEPALAAKGEPEIVSPPKPLAAFLQNLTLVIEQLSSHVSPARLPQVVCSIWRRKPREAPIRLAAV